MPKAKKATKKFQKQHLKDVLERRKKTQKIKIGITNRKKQKSYRRENENFTESKGKDRIQENKPIRNLQENQAGDFVKNLDEMDLDDFFGSEGEGLTENEYPSDYSEPSKNESDELGNDDENCDNSEKAELNKNITKMRKQSVIGKSGSQHKEQLQALKEKDPKFYKYLQENDAELLDFDVSDDGLDDDDDYGSQDEYDDLENETLGSLEQGSVEAHKKETSQLLLTKEMVSTWQKSIIEKHSLRSLRRLLLAFRAGAHIDEDEDGVPYAYKITSPAVFNNLIVVCLKYVTDVFDHYLNYAEEDSKKKLPSANTKWKSIEPLVKSYLISLLHMLRNLSEDDMIYFVVKESEKSVPYYLCFPRLSRDYLKALLGLWASAQDKVRIISFLNIRKLGSTGSSHFIDTCLKGIYTTFVRYCKSTTVYTIPSINLMSNCGVEIYGLNFKASYQSGFVYIRQLAIHLRNSMLVKSKESYQAVYNWQFIHCLEFWSQVLATYCDQKYLAENGECQLQALIYPLVQVCLGVIRLIPTAQHFPLHFHCLRAMIRIIQKTGTFIPLAPHIFDILDSAEIHRKPKPSTLKSLDFTLNLKAPKNYLGTRIYQDGICEELVDIMLEYYGSFCLSIAFPELAIPAIVQLKRHIKKSKNSKFNKQLHHLVEKFEQNSKYIEQHRAQIEFAPNDRAKVETFMQNTDPDNTPLGSYVSAVRTLKIQRLRILKPENHN
ncbi:hypothetical protein G9A89_011147 [Geosiphon pyriformis]|nr:hypothetical protein G9A89_011147 [Geosiphon pyriformis]